MPRPRSLGPIHYQLAVQLEARVERGDGRSLGLVIRQGPSTWAALALEHPDVAPASGLEAAEGVLADHAHAIVGEFTSEKKARAACRAYALAWMNGRKVEEACGCDSITTGGSRPPSPQETSLRSIGGTPDPVLRVG